MRPLENQMKDEKNLFKERSLDMNTIFIDNFIDFTKNYPSLEIPKPDFFMYFCRKFSTTKKDMRRVLLYFEKMKILILNQQTICLNLNDPLIKRRIKILNKSEVGKKMENKNDSINIEKGMSQEEINQYLDNPDFSSEEERERYYQKMEEKYWQQRYIDEMVDKGR